MERSRTPLEQWRITQHFANRRGRLIHAKAFTEAEQTPLTSDQAFNRDVEKFIAMLGISPVSYREFQHALPDALKLSRWYAGEITDEQKVSEVLLGVSYASWKRRFPWNATHCVDWDAVEALLNHSDEEKSKILNNVFRKVAGLSFKELEQEAIQNVVIAAGKLPADRLKCIRSGRAYSHCPHENRWCRDELFGYRFQVETVDQEWAYSYGNPPEQETQSTIVSYHATLKQAICATFSHFGQGNPNRAVMVYFKDHALLSGSQVGDAYQWERICESYARNNVVCPINQTEVMECLFQVETALFGEISSAEDFLMDDLGL
jgi:hypothetical protein